MNQAFSREVLRVVVAQVCHTIGWHCIQTTPLELMVDVLQRYLSDVCKVTHRYSEQFGQTIPNLDHLGLAFQDLGIDLQELGDYVRNVDSVPCPLEVPKYPVERKTRLNFLKPGSNEVVHRPVHVHEHLPPMHPDLEDPVKKPPLLSEGPSTSADGAIMAGGVFKRPGDPLESPALKRTRVLLEEEGRALREISSVIMTTSGFLSPAREGKLPESRAPFIPSDTERHSPTPSSYPTVPPEIKSEKKSKKSVSKKTTPTSKKFEKENSKKKDKEGGKSEKTKGKKLASTKEVSKLKASKTKAKKVPPIAAEGNPKDFANFIQNLFQTTNQTKNKPDDQNWLGPGTSKDAGPSEVNVPEGKLSTEPDKQKLNILKKISKVKEEKIDREELSRDTRETSQDVVIEEVIERSWMSTTPSASVVAAASHVSDIEDDEIYISDTLSPPGTPSTPRTPEFPPKIGGKKRKKDKSKSKSKVPSKKIKLELVEEEPLERPKTPETPVVPSLFPFNTPFPLMPGPIPPPIMHPLFPNLPILNKGPIANLPHPAMPNLPIPPASFMQASTSQPVREETAVTEVTTSSALEKPVEKEKEKKPKDKNSKKEEGGKKPKKKKLKKEKVKNKDKSEKKKEKEEKKNKDKEKSKEKKEKKKDKEKEDKPEPSIPKLTLKLGLDTSRPATPEQSRKIVIKPVIKKEPSPTPDTKRAASPELARISALITRQPKKSKASDSVAPEVAAVEIKQEGKSKDGSKKASHAAGSSKDTMAFYHHARVSGPTKPPRRTSGAASATGDDAGNTVWICPACKGPDDGSPMIGCDGGCDAWYHWVCVGIQVPPDDKEDWYCRDCIQKKQESFGDKKKKQRKKKFPN